MKMKFFLSNVIKCANNVKIRLHGAHIIGKILMDHCPRINASQSPKAYFDDEQENVKI